MTSVRRRAAALALGVTALVSLSGCDKPSPSVTVFSGDTYTRSEARCWDRSGDAVDADSAGCSDEEGIASLEVRAGQTIGISVDPAIADAGWFPAVGAQRIADTINETYYRFTLSDGDLAKGPLNLQIIALDDAEKAPRGLWRVDLEKN